MSNTKQFGSNIAVHLFNISYDLPVNNDETNIVF